MTTIKHFTIATVAEQSADFRRVLWTGRHAQLVIMTIPPGGDIGEETHEDTDQILTFVDGTGEADVAGETTQVAPGELVVVPAGTRQPVDRALDATLFLQPAEQVLQIDQPASLNGRRRWRCRTSSVRPGYGAARAAAPASRRPLPCGCRHSG